MIQWLERRLGERLLTVAAQVRGEVVCDVGSDHGLLAAYLLRTQRCRRVICVEKHLGPYERTKKAVPRATVLLGDGLVYDEPVDCLCLCGFGARSIAAILTRDRAKVPARLVIQPHREPSPVLLWAEQEGFHVTCVMAGRFPVFTLELQRS